AVTERADLRTSVVGAAQQLLRTHWRMLGSVLVLDAMAAARRAQVLAQELAGAGVQQAHMPDVPLHTDPSADPARRRTIVSRFDFDAAVQVHRAFAVLVIAEGLDGQRQQGRSLFGEYHHDLPLGGAM